MKNLAFDCKLSVRVHRAVAVLVIAINFWAQPAFARCGGLKVTLRLSVPVGESLKVEVPQLSFLGICQDDAVARMVQFGDSLTFLGGRAGVTQCYFWSGEQGLETLAEVTVGAPSR